MIIFYIICPLVLAMSYYLNLYPLVVIVLMFFFVDYYKSEKKYPSRQLLLSLFLFLLFHNYWIYSLYPWVGGKIAALFLTLGLTLYFFVFFFIFFKLIRIIKEQPFSFIILGIAWTIFERLLTLGPFGYPFYSLYLTQVYAPYLYIAYNPFGASLLTFGLVSITAFIAKLIVCKEKQEKYIPGLLFIILLLIVLTGIRSLLPEKAAHNQRQLQVALVQTDVKEELRHNADYYENLLNNYLQLLTFVVSKEKNLDVIILPESIIPALWENKIVRLLNENDVIGKKVLIFGLPARRDNKIYNSVMFYRDGNVEKNYYKNHLVPFGERVPWLFGFLRPMDLVDYDASRTIEPVTIQSVRYGTVICYESAFPALYKRIKDSDLFLVLTNDAWFHACFKELHLRSAICRAAEYRKYLLFVSNGGKSAVIDENGRIRRILPSNKEGYIIYKVPL
ncbi:MAG: apolipoprotein N-acyltransferase [Candidatus Margulisbacteria bacterium]|nr:apolipoprotein N-acyltransferase [Candidatus Margulisiibacteriota bacterium]